MASQPVYLELVDFLASGTTPQSVADFHPSPVAQQRALELVARAKESQLSPDEQSELNYFVELEHILRIAKAKARQILASQR